MVFLAFVCMFTQLKSMYIVIKLIVHYNFQCQLLARLASLIRVMLRDNADSDNFINRLSMQVKLCNTLYKIMLMK